MLTPLSRSHQGVVEALFAVVLPGRYYPAIEESSKLLEVSGYEGRGRHSSLSRRSHRCCGVNCLRCYGVTTVVLVCIVD